MLSIYALYMGLYTNRSMCSFLYFQYAFVFGFSLLPLTEPFRKTFVLVKPFSWNFVGALILNRDTNRAQQKNNNNFNQVKISSWFAFLVSLKIFF